MDGIAIMLDDIMPEGHQVLWRGGAVIWAGPLGAPIEDVEFDAITIHPNDIPKIESH